MRKEPDRHAPQNVGLQDATPDLFTVQTTTILFCSSLQIAFYLVILFLRDFAAGIAAVKNLSWRFM